MAEDALAARDNCAHGTSRLKGVRKEGAWEADTGLLSTSASSRGNTATTAVAVAVNMNNHATAAVGRLVRDVRRQERADMRNRFLSIDMDAQFVSGLVSAYRRAGCAYPVFANLRNGLWYAKEWDGACYFKSTDGHSLRWSFSYTRLNMHLAASAAASGGCIVVDSTRTGKRFPDSFTATVPIWCCVLNRLAAPGAEAVGVSCGSADDGPDGEIASQGEGSKMWDTELHTPTWLSASEANQIEERIPQWLEGLGEARGLLSKRLRSFLKKPLRPVWLSPESRLVEGMLPACPPAELSFTPVICVSASKVISPERHREHHSWTYLQGAGDDEEHWSSGLTPEKFWENSELLVGLANSGDRSAFETVVEALLTDNRRRISAIGGGVRRRGGARDESPNAIVSPNTEQLAEQSSTDNRGSSVGGEGGCEIGVDPWVPGGPEVHAVLGTTGLVVGSLAFGARSWASQGKDCSLLNLSDQPFPESFLKSLTGSGRRYLHIPLKAGKKANPPRYWKTQVFPAALSFIAATIGGVSPRKRDISTAEGDVDPASRSVALLRECGGELCGSKDERGTQAERAVGLESLPYMLPLGEANVGEEGLAQSAGGPPSSTAVALPDDNSHTQPLLSELSRKGRQHRSCPAAREPAGRCLVVCPTGAEASVVVCLSALAAFFSSVGDTVSSPTASADETKGQTQIETCSRARGERGVDDGELGLQLGRGGFNVLRRGAGVVTKAQLRWLFILLQQECPWARPPRRLMQELNEYFMTPGKHSWWTLSDYLVGSFVLGDV